MKQLYDDNKNPTELLNQLSSDIHKSGIFQVMDKYSKELPDYEILGFIMSELNVHTARTLLLERVKIRKETNEQ